MRESSMPVDDSCVSTRPESGGRTGRIGVQMNGPELGVGTSGRGLVNATEERQLMRILPPPAIATEPPSREVY